MASGSATTSRPVKTCTECKQSKLRCDSKDQFPNPCSRCQARHLFCTVDASFKRTPARKRLEAMNRELQELRNQKDGERQASVTEQTVGSASSDYQPPNEDAEDDLELRAPIISLDGFFLEPATATDIFTIFVGVFRPQLPIIGPLSTGKIYETQPFLFWTIIAVVMSHSPREDHVELFRQLREPYVRFLREQILEAPLPLYKIQALVFIIEWPLGVETQTQDPSWLYCGTAIQAARFMSLDRQQMVPSLRSLGVAAGSIHARINTWIGCFYVATSLAMHLGLPTMIDSELDFAAIHDFLRQKTVPHAFATLVKVQLVVARFTSLLNRDLDDAASSSLIRLLDTELNALKPDGLMDDDQSRSVELCILDAKMHFYTLFITKTPHGLSSREITLRTAFSHALRIIHISTSEWRARPEGRTDPVLIQKQRSLPKNHHRSFAFATIFLLRFFHRSGTASMEERQLAANHISLAGEHFKACSIEPLDEYSRTAKVFEVLARTTPSDVGSKMRLTHRMGVSILLDAVANAGEVRGKPVTLAEERPPDQGNQIDGTFQDMREMGYSADEVEVGLNVLGGLWEDPILSMLNFEPMSPMAE